MNWSEKDLQQLKTKGIMPEAVEKQIVCFVNGFPFIKLARAAKAGNGIMQLSTADLDRYSKLYDEDNTSTRSKFVPASGAATRMFKALFEFESSFRIAGGNASILENDAYKHVKEVFEKFTSFAFYTRLKALLEKQGHSSEMLLKEKKYELLLDALMGEAGLNYRNLPKGLLHFHAYNNQVRTPLEEHLVEGASHATNPDGRVNLHFTVSPEHLDLIKKLIEKKKPALEEHHKVNYNITYSVQKPSTDTIGVDKNNQPVRETDGSLHFRPAGHGALLGNLAEMDAVLIFIKNIDNVVPDRLKAETIRYKKVLAGILLDCRGKIFNYIRQLEKTASEELLKEVELFLRKVLCVEIKIDKLDLNHKREYLLEKLNRPIRVCGMVKNVGEPGGGPFWVTNPDNSVSLQIVEGSQVDPKDNEQQAILTSSTHFNPVDLVCCIRDYKGAKFDLVRFINPKTGFISRKSKDGQPLKALELPGLWNGAMANWNTIFVEVPLITFNPVKTINDLLRPEHQP